MSKDSGNILLKTFLLFIIFLTGCGKTKNPFVEPFFEPFSKEQDGLYRGSIRTLNKKTNSRIRGQATVFINGIQFYAKIKVKTRWKDVRHIQAIFSGDECPELSDDTNKDGFIDIDEVKLRSGKMLIPLDGDLKGQTQKFAEYPVSNRFGSYVYGIAASLKMMLKDLKIPKEGYDFLDNLVQGEKLNVTKRVVIIFGVPNYYKLPDSVKRIHGFSPQLSLPIGCSKLSESLDPFP